MSTEAKPFKDTLNLPVTRFEMKANLTVREPRIQAEWRERDVYSLIRKNRAGRARKVLHDGPPYANGEIHMGHLFNKVLKDFVTRYLTQRGFDSPYVPGWDCHGLPIEHKVMKDLGAKAATLDAAQIRALCHDEAMKWVAIQREQFQRLGVMGDWDNPYLTLAPEYEASIIDLLADLVEGGFVFRQLKPIHWCTTDRTALAEAELEYAEATSPSIYVNFPMLTGVPVEWGHGPWHAMIWTTTPWTLPANVAIAAHPDVVYAGIRYAKPETGKLVHTIVAADLAARLLALRGISQFDELGRCLGAALEHAQYKHVFLDRTGPLVLADYVTVDDGTGLVHTAPGHGAEDYRTGQKYDLPTLSPVDEAGRFTEEAPDWLLGQTVFKANTPIVDHLRSSGALFHSYSFAHSYPHCWRCKRPVIFRATAQWFIKVDHSDLRGRTLKVIAEDVAWLPAWGEARMEGMVRNRPDWCISRQRHWGVPIPVLYDERTGAPHLTAESLRFYRDLFRREGADAWFQRPVADLIPPDMDPAAFPPEVLRKGIDILDVWFESGSSHRAVLSQNFKLGYPTFMYLEGSDQHRGWFQSSLLTAVAATGRAPFETVLTHGFVVDEKGEKMSKSVGNTISAVQATEKYGTDVLRLYVASMDYSDDIRISERGIKEASEAYRKIRNTFRFLLGNLGDYTSFDPATVDPSTLHEIDRWLLGQLNALIREVTSAFDKFEFYRGYQHIYQFCSVTLSSFYLDVLKDRLYAELPAGPDRRAAQFVLWRLHETLAVMLAAIIPHTAEEVWSFLPSGSDRPESVHLADWPVPEPAWDDQERDEVWELLQALRAGVYASSEKMRALKLVGSSQEVSIEFRKPPNPRIVSYLAEQPDLLTTVCIASEVTSTYDPRENFIGLEFSTGSFETYRSTHPKCERCWNHREDVGQDVENPTLCKRCARVMRALVQRSS